MDKVLLTFSYTIAPVIGTLSLTVSEEINNLWYKNTGGREAFCRELLIGRLAQEALITDIRVSETKE